ncbi:glycosyltransferase family 39 protein [Dictyobacter halimunensis]
MTSDPLTVPGEQSPPDNELKSKQEDTQEEDQRLSTWKKWRHATIDTLPTFIAIHLAVFVASCMAILFTVKDYSSQVFPLYTIWGEWNRWDTGNFIRFANQGYIEKVNTAFFPLYPLLIKYVQIITFNDGLLAGLLISSIADLVMLIVLYQLVYEEVGQEQARRAVLYISIFPTAFFYLAAYNESLFLCFTIMLFYCMRHRRWWLAGICGIFAMLSRSVGILLVFPFLYEYLRQRHFQIRNIRFDILSVALIPAALIAYGCYCYLYFGSFFSFATAQQNWYRQLVFPGYNLWLGFQFMLEHGGGILSFITLRTLTDALPDIFIFIVLILAIVGPWRLRRDQMVYVVYGLIVFAYVQMYPTFRPMTPPLEALSRYLLEIFPAFITLAIIGKNRLVNQCYLLVSGSLFFFLLTQFITGHWVI